VSSRAELYIPVPVQVPVHRPATSALDCSRMPADGVSFGLMLEQAAASGNIKTSSRTRIAPPLVTGDYVNAGQGIRRATLGTGGITASWWLPRRGDRQRLDEAVIRTGTDENVTPYYL
jgi:hypothetical protein